MLDNMANTIESRNQMLRIPFIQQIAVHISSADVSIILGVGWGIFPPKRSNGEINRPKKIFISKGLLEHASDYAI